MLIHRMSLMCIIFVTNLLSSSIYLYIYLPAQNKTIENNPHEDVLLSGEHLVLQSVTRGWSGEFQCRATNSVGFAASNTIEVDVHCELFPISMLLISSNCISHGLLTDFF